MLDAAKQSVIYAECHYAEVRLCWVLFVLSVTNKPILLCVIMMSGVMKSFLAPFVSNAYDS